MSAEDSIRWLPVGEVGEVRMGKQLSPASRANGKQLPYLRVANVLDGRIDYSDVNLMGFTPSERLIYLLRPGDILLNEGQSLELVGRSAIYKEPANVYYFQNTLVRFRAGGAVLPEYAQAVFSWWLRIGVFAAIAKKTTSIAHLGGDRFAKLSFPLRPLAEQRRIVEVFSALDDQEKSIEASIVKGRLVRGEIMRKILSSQERGWAVLGDVAAVSSGSTPSRSRGDYWVGGTVPWVRTAEINFSVIADSGECVTRRAVTETGLRVYPKGTVLLAMYGEGVTRGRSAVLGVDATVNQAAAAIVCDPTRLDNRYLYHWLESSYNEIRKIGQGSNQTNLNGTLVGSICLPLPSIEEQRRLVAPIEAFDQRLASDRDELAKLQTLKNGLTDDLLSGNARLRNVA
ncbi:restriction endonuclease subunit S [Streptomyces sp. NPDC002935]|uniref:restriction endonuclease subunit S n=1 Tax=Streptomyces sp. NPDC002935 TaxID=3154545 RepID=UPI00339ECC63